VSKKAKQRGFYFMFAKVTKTQLQQKAVLYEKAIKHSYNPVNDHELKLENLV
jgi:hypothetical protein